MDKDFFIYNFLLGDSTNEESDSTNEESDSTNEESDSITDEIFEKIMDYYDIQFNKWELLIEHEAFLSWDDLFEETQENHFIFSRKGFFFLTYDLLTLQQK